MRARSVVMGGLFLGVVVGGVLSRTGRTVEAAAGVKSANEPAYTRDGDMIAPGNYREWVFLTSGFDMTYRERTGVPDHSVFDNVFVNPEAYASFLTTGTWPDKTVLVLENRGAQAKDGAIVKGGRFQGAGVEGLELHVKDAGRFKRGGVGGDWGFFDVGKDGVGKVFAPSESCYSCHAQHAAVDTTFVQFYPTLIDLAVKKGTFDKGIAASLVGAGGK